MHTPDLISYGIACAVVGAALVVLLYASVVGIRRALDRRQRRNHRITILHR